MKIIDINGEERECVSASPDPKFAGYMKVEFASRNRPGYKHSEWYPTGDFIKNNPSLKNLTTNAPKVIKEDLGTVSKGNLNSLTDTTKRWSKDEYVGFPIWISRGTGEGQTRIVTSNSRNTLLIDKKWNTVPDKSSQYVLSHNVHDPQIRGNTLPVSETKSLTKKNLKCKN